MTTPEAGRTTDAERPEYSVDQVGDDQAPRDADPLPDNRLIDAETYDDTDRAAIDADLGTSEDATPPREVSSEEPLVATSDAVDFKARWDVVQQGFVDDPRSAVTDADKLVGDVLDRLSNTFDEQHRTLEGQWSNGEPSTEDLRSALQRYRAFFERLLTI